MQRLFPHKYLPRPAESGQPPDGSEVQATSFEMDKVELSVREALQEQQEPDGRRLVGRNQAQPP